MNTLDLVTLLETYINNSPAKLVDFDWRLIYDCFIAEFKLREAFYSPSKSEQFISYLNNLIFDAEQASRFGDYFRLQKVVMCLRSILLTFPEETDEFSFSQKANFDHAALNHYQKNTTIVLGDSHVNFFSGNELLNFHSIGNSINICPQINSLNLSVLYVGSCLAFTCMRPDSSVRFYSKFLYLKDTFIKPGANIVLSLGEIDLRCHVFKQADLQHRDYRQIIDDILIEYQRFIISMLNNGYKVFCWGPIGTQKDIVQSDTAYPRYGSEEERNTASFYFTDKLSNICKKEGAHCLSILDKLVTPNMITRPEYLSPDQFHLGQKAFDLVRPLLKEYKLI